MTAKKNTNETETVTYSYQEEKIYKDDQLEPFQNIEGGGGPKKVTLKSMPLFIRCFGYFFLLIVPAIYLFVFVIDLLR